MLSGAGWGAGCVSSSAGLLADGVVPGPGLTGIVLESVSLSDFLELPGFTPGPVMEVM